MTTPHSESSQYHVVVAGGGTAGHIEPALAVADALSSSFAVTVTALGTNKGLERDLVPARGYDLKLIDPVPVPRKFSMDLLKLPLRVRRAVQQTQDILRDVHADALIGFGGYVSAPAYLAARRLGIPHFVHEANARAGLANKLGMWLGGTCFTAVPHSGLRGEVVGVPIRPALSSEDPEVAAQRGRSQWNLRPDVPTLLVTGGSQGARRINSALEQSVERLVAQGFQVLHAYGKKNPRPQSADEIEGYTAVPYISDMAAAYAVADLAICRSGAMTVAEVTAAHLPAIYVPLPHGNGEQALNAQKVVEAGAALILPDEDCEPERVMELVTQILGNPEKQAAMREAAQDSGAGSVAHTIAQRIVDALHARDPKTATEVLTSEEGE